MLATATSGVNIALVKYWGKADLALNLPAVGSISLTLSWPGTTTTVEFDPALDVDLLELDGEPADAACVPSVLGAIREAAGIETFARVVSTNSVPTAAGLASSASAMAALTVAGWAAAGLLPDAARIAQIARLGSGSAPRSLLGGLVELDAASGAVRQLASADAWDLRVVIGVCGRGQKAVSSRVGMRRSAETSPYYRAWVDSHAADLAEARAAIAARDLERLGRVMEHSTLKMHACMLASRPPLRYWRAATLAAVEAIEALPGYFTMDAGPHIKVLCAASDAGPIASALEATEGVDPVWIAEPGPGAALCPS